MIVWLILFEPPNPPRLGNPPAAGGKGGKDDKGPLELEETQPGEVRASQHHATSTSTSRDDLRV
jgi:hypothetical protein